MPTMCHRMRFSSALTACATSFAILWPSLAGAEQSTPADTMAGSAATLALPGAEDSAAERMEAADILRMLSQEIPAAACHLHHGIDAENSRKLMLDAKLKFAKILDALEHGDEELYIYAPETRPKTLRDIEQIRAVWTPMIEAALKLLEAPDDRAAYDLIRTQNEGLYELTSHLLSEISGQYSNPTELTQLNALLLEIAGRQEALTQRISKEACVVWSGYDDEEHLGLLDKSVESFELGITALYKGMPSLGIIAAPTPEISQGLEEVVGDWQEMKTLLQTVSDGTAVDADKASIFTRLNEKTKKMEDIIHLYALYSKQR